MIKQKHMMAQDAPLYHKNALVYNLFSKAEDYPGYVFRYLSSKVINKEVLDVGCGSGKYLNLLAPISRHYTGLDCSKEQIYLAEKKAINYPNASLICNLAHKTNLQSDSIDVIIAIWVIESTRNKEQILSEMHRVLRNPGVIYVVENAGNSEFEDIVKRDPDISTTKENKIWLFKHGFKVVKNIKSYFLFKSVIQAREVFSTIWGNDIASRIHNKKIGHNINIYKKEVLHERLYF